MTGRRGKVYGPLIFTTCGQPDYAPRIDRAFCHDAEGRHYSAVAIRRRGGEAWVIGLRTDWSRRLSRLALPMLWLKLRFRARFMTSSRRAQHQSSTLFESASGTDCQASPRLPETESSTQPERKQTIGLPAHTAKPHSAS